MSIDYRATLSRHFSVHSFVDDVHRAVNELVPGGAPIEAAFWPSTEDLGPGRPGLTDGLDRWMCGPGFEDRSIALALVPNVQVDIGIFSNDDPADRDPTVWFGATASFRTPESVVVAIASTIAAARVGHGSFEEVRDHDLP